MDCIKYIDDLKTEIQILKDLKGNIECDEDELLERIERKEEILNRCKENLSKLSNNQICYRIYLHILNGLSLNQAVDKVAEENMFNGIKPMTSYAIWKNYYPILKKILKK